MFDDVSAAIRGMSEAPVPPAFPLGNARAIEAWLHPAATRARELSAAPDTRTPIRRMRSGCCARSARGHPGTRRRSFWDGHHEIRASWSAQDHRIARRCSSKGHEQLRHCREMHSKATVLVLYRSW